jgi:hypothetical protein
MFAEEAKRRLIVVRIEIFIKSIQKRFSFREPKFITTTLRFAATKLLSSIESTTFPASAPFSVTSVKPAIPLSDAALSVAAAESTFNSIGTVSGPISSIADRLKFAPDAIGDVSNLYKTWGSLLEKVDVVVKAVDAIAEVLSLALVAVHG